MAGSTLRSSARELAELLPAIADLAPQLESFGNALLASWKQGGKLLTCGNGGSAADAMHFSEELVVRFQKNRRALAAIALHDPTVLTCAGNDFGYESVFARQVEALGRPGDVLAVFTTSGNSPNILAAVETAKKSGLVTAAFLGRDGGKLRSRCTHELLVPASTAHRTQEGHLLLYHSLCQWLDTQFD